MWDTLGTIIYFIIIIVLLPLLLILYVIGGILDLTYFERHKKDYENNCPYYIEGEQNER